MRGWTAILVSLLGGGCGDAPPPRPDPIPHAAEIHATGSEQPEASRSPARVLRVGRATELDAYANLDSVEEIDLALSADDHLGRLAEADGEPGACDGLDLVALAQRLPALQSLRISGCQSAIHAGLQAFESTVRHLELADVVLDGVSVGRVGELQHLESLTLTRVTRGSDSLAPLRRLPVQRITLRELELDSPLAELLGQWPTGLTHAELSGSWAGHKAMLYVAKAKNLESLTLTGTRIGNFSLNQIKPLGRLREVVWSGSTFNDRTPLYVRNLPIRRFVCACPKLGDGGLKALRHVARVQSIELLESRVSDAGIAHLVELEGLRELVVQHRAIEAEGLSALAELPSLRRLVLGGIAIDEPSLEPLGGLVQLEELELTYHNLDDRLAPQLEKLLQLRRLDLGGTQISDAALEAIGKLERLERLELHHTRVTNKGLAHLANLRALELLELDHTDVVDDGVAHLSGLSQLRELRLDSTLITDRSIDTLIGLRNLERLNLANTVVTAEGAARLGDLPNLRAVNVQDTRAAGR